VASTSSHPTGSAKPSWDATATLPVQTESPPHHVSCTLWVPDSLVGQVGRGLKLAATISKARIAVLGPSTEPGAARKATIHGSSEEVGMALMVMGKRIAQQHVPNPQRKPKPKRPTPTTSSMAAEGRPTPSLPPPAISRDPPTAADFAAGREAARVAALLTWPPDGIPPFAPRTPPTPGAWDGKPAAHRRGAAPQQPAGTTAQAAEARCQAIEQMEDNDYRPQTTRWSGSGPGRGRGHAPRAQERYSPTAEYHACTIAWLEAMVDAYTRVLERGDNDVDDNDQPCQTARWSGGGPSRGHGLAPQTDTADHTQPRETAR
jgi:hypothetical protein